MDSSNREAVKARFRERLAAQKQMSAREYIANLLHATRTHAEAEAMLDEVVAEAVEKERQERAADHRTWQHDLGTLRAAQAEVERLRKENADLKARLQAAWMVKVWKNEDGKRFIFADDIFPALHGKDPS